MNPGKLDRRITLQSRNTTRDGEGSPIVSYVDEAAIWAQQVELSSREARSAGALRSDTTLLLRIRYRSTLTAQHRIIHEGRTYDINGDPTEDLSQGRRVAMFVQAKYTEGAAT